MTAKAYVLMSKYHGSNQQLLAFARCVASQHEINAIRCEVASRASLFHGFYRLTIRLCNKLGTGSTIARGLRRLVLKYNHPTVTDDDVIISKTPPFEFPSAILSAGSSAVTYHLGQPKRLPKEQFSHIISTPSTPAEDASLSLETLPSQVTYSEFLKARDTSSAENDNWTVLLGGNAKSYRYEQPDWHSILSAIIKRARQQDTKLLISTSPRTGLATEQMIEALASDNADVIDELVLWEKGQRKPVLDCLARSTLVFVSEDSAAMMSDAINTRLPTVIVRPEHSDYNALTTGFAVYHDAKGAALRATPSQLDTIDLASWLSCNFKPIDSCWSQILKEKLI